MKLTHVDSQGQSKMVDVGEKNVVPRTAVAEGKLAFSHGTRQLILDAGLPKGNPFEVARLAGIQAAKQTSLLVPLCHNIGLDFADVQIELQEDGFLVRSRVSCHATTGVEMEALTATAVAALTLYDMCKAVDKEMVIQEIRVTEKTKNDSMQLSPRG